MAQPKKRTWVYFVPRGYPSSYCWVIRGVLVRRVSGGGMEVKEPDSGKFYYAARDRITKLEVEE